jgi:glucose/arabinose dehydrogenase/mono/diheme cytochrome c family protein
MKLKSVAACRAMLLAAIGLPIASLFVNSPAAQAQAQSAAPQDNTCAPDNGGITLPPGFCASVFADNVGHARDLVVGPNGVLYVNTWSGPYYHDDTPPPGGFLIALQDIDGDGQADAMIRFGGTMAQGSHGGSGIAYYHGAIYAEVNDKIVRYKLPKGVIAPEAKPEVIVSGLPLTGDHPMHPFVIDPRGNLYVDLASPTNACQVQNRIANSPGIQPCTELETRAGIWRYNANKMGQKFSPAERFVTGLRNGEGLAFDSAGRLLATQHGRDQLSENWPKLYNEEQGANLPAEELMQLTEGDDFGWPACYFDDRQNKRVLAPEYGGDGGKTVGLCADKKAPIASFPAHWAPNSMAIYLGRAFPEAYRDGAFIAFHGSWNRAPLPQEGFNVVFQPLKDGKASGKYVVFADGFAGAHKDPGEAAHRPSGLTVGPDGSLYITDDAHGRIWRVTYQGKPSAPIEPAATPKTGASAAPAGAVLPPEGIHPNAGQQASLPVPPGSSPEQVALGGRVFHGQVDGGTCAGCHGSNAKGTSVGADLTSGKWLWGDGSLAAIEQTIITGVSQPKQSTGVMPPLGGANLSRADVTAVASYVWALSHQNQ